MFRRDRAARDAADRAEDNLLQQKVRECGAAGDAPQQTQTEGGGLRQPPRHDFVRERVEQPQRFAGGELPLRRERQCKEGGVHPTLVRYHGDAEGRRAVQLCYAVGDRGWSHKYERHGVALVLIALLGQRDDTHSQVDQSRLQGDNLSGIRRGDDVHLDREVQGTIWFNAAWIIRLNVRFSFETWRFLSPSLRALLQRYKTTDLFFTDAFTARHISTTKIFSRARFRASTDCRRKRGWNEDGNHCSRARVGLVCRHRLRDLMERIAKIMLPPNQTTTEYCSAKLEEAIERKREKATLGKNCFGASNPFAEFS